MNNIEAALATNNAELATTKAKVASINAELRGINAGLMISSEQTELLQQRFQILCANTAVKFVACLQERYYGAKSTKGKGSSQSGHSTTNTKKNAAWLYREREHVKKRFPSLDGGCIKLLNNIEEVTIC